MQSLCVFVCLCLSVSLALKVDCMLLHLACNIEYCTAKFARFGFSRRTHGCSFAAIPMRNGNAKSVCLCLPLCLFVSTAVMFLHRSARYSLDVAGTPSSMRCRT